MAVKQKNIVVPVPQTSAEQRLQLILRTLQTAEIPNDNKVNMYINIVLALGTVVVPSDPDLYMKFMEDIKKIQNLLLKECGKGNNEIIFVTLRALYEEISNPAKNPSPVMSIVLQLIDIEHIPTAVKFIINSGYREQSLERALYTLCTWLTKWTCSENLGPLVLAFMKGLEDEHYYDILIDVTLECIEPLFRLIILPSNRESVFPVVLFLLTRIQNNSQALNKILPHCAEVLKIMARDDTNRIYLLQLINVLASLINQTTLYENKPLAEILKTFQTDNDLIKLTSKNQAWPNNNTNVLSTQIHVTSGKVGLYNLGNTCYMNSVLQALFMTKTFRNQVLLQDDSNTSPLLSKLQILFALLQHSKKYSLSPKDILTLLRPPGFILGHQHDSSEFLGYLLDTLHEQENNINPSYNAVGIDDDQGATALPLPLPPPPPPPPSGLKSNDTIQTIVQQSFGGKMVTESHCAKCGTKSERIDSFRELQLSFPQNINNPGVQNLLEYFFQPEPLCGDNQYRCDICNTLTDGERITKIVSSPTHLILTLKHFKYDSTSQIRTKLLQRINMDNRIYIDDVAYELYASVVHCGTSADSGHYYTFAKDSTGWYKFNDSTVSKTLSDSLHVIKPPETPYILFYSREDLKEPNDLLINQLSTSLQSIICNDNMESDLEKKLMFNNKNISSNSTIINKYNKRNDDPPPPGCGGSDFNTTSGNMFVC